MPAPCDMPRGGEGGLFALRLVDQQPLLTADSAGARLFSSPGAKVQRTEPAGVRGRPSSAGQRVWPVNLATCRATRAYRKKVRLSWRGNESMIKAPSGLPA